MGVASNTTRLSFNSKLKVIGHGSRPFVLSRKFFHNIYSSPFPSDSGKRATNFSSWLLRQQEDLRNDGVAIAPDLQCGEIVHLFSLVLSGEISVSPRLPNCGIGEADELKGLESFLSLGDMGDVGTSKKSKRKVDVPCSSEKLKKPKPQTNADGNRREKGFPGIEVFLKMETVSDADAFECLGLGRDNNHALAKDYTSVEETICLTSSLDDVDVTHDMGPKSCWHAMTKYFKLLASASAITNEAIPSSTDFEYVHSIIYQAGKQGLSMDEISSVLKIKGEEAAEMFVDTLEVFQLAAKVNAFDSIRVVDSSHTSKYFISVPGRVKIHNQGYDVLACPKPQDMSSGTSGPFKGRHDNVDYSLVNPSVGVCSENKTIARDMSNYPCEHRIEGQPFGEGNVIGKDSRSDESFHEQDSGVGSVRNSVAGMPGAFQPILPWMNGDGSINMNVYKGLTRRLLGIVMQNPCILEEDIITKMDVLNPQSCRRLLETMVLDNHIKVRRVPQTANPASPPTILQSLFPSNLKPLALKLQTHYFANPMSTRML